MRRDHAIRQIGFEQMRVDEVLYGLQAGGAQTAVTSLLDRVRIGPEDESHEIVHMAGENVLGGMVRERLVADCDFAHDASNLRIEPSG